MQKTKNNKLHKGFTILEISIVLVIVGLLVAGVLGGQEVIKAMKINGTISQMNEITAAANSFKLKYDSIPGDMPDATDYWGVNGSGSAINDGSCNNFNKETRTTCNGDGNGLVRGGSGDLGGNFEYETFWQHLRLAEMYITTDPVGNQFYGSELLATKLSDNYGFYVDSSLGYTSLTTSYNPNLTGKNLFGIWYKTSISMKSDEARDLDFKMDDGRPLTGNFSLFWSDIDPECITSAELNTYAVDKYECMPIILANF